MYVIITTIAATGVAQPIFDRTVPYRNARFQSILLQNRGSNSMTIGDSQVTTTNGIQLTSAGSLTASQFMAGISDLQDFYVVGTANDVLVTMVLK